MSEYRLKTGKIGEKVVGAYEKVEDDEPEQKNNEETAQENTENQSE